MRYESIIEALLEHCASADAPSGFEQAAIDIVLKTKAAQSVYFDSEDLEIKITESSEV